MVFRQPFGLGEHQEDKTHPRDMHVSSRARGKVSQSFENSWILSVWQKAPYNLTASWGGDEYHVLHEPECPSASLDPLFHFYSESQWLRDNGREDFHPFHHFKAIYSLRSLFSLSLNPTSIKTQELNCKLSDFLTTWPESQSANIAKKKNSFPFVNESEQSAIRMNFHKA